jgi:hypothetical protein
MTAKRCTPPQPTPAREDRGADIPLAEIRRFARQVAERFQPDKIILFGSYAYSAPHADSDSARRGDGTAGPPEWGRYVLPLATRNYVAGRPVDQASFRRSRSLRRAQSSREQRTTDNGPLTFRSHNRANLRPLGQAPRKTPR